MRRFLAVVAVLVSLPAGAIPQEEKREQMVWLRDLATARTMAEREWRLTVLYFYGDVAGDGDARKHHKHIDELFKDDNLKKYTRDFIGVRVSCHTYPDEARRYGAAKGPMVVILGPDGKELGKSLNCDVGTLTMVLGRFASDFAPATVSWRCDVAPALAEARILRGLVLVCGHEKDCKTCQQAQEMLVTRRMVVPRRRLMCVRLEKKENVEKLKELGVGVFPHLTLIRPGKKPEDEPKTVVTRAWPANAKALAAIVEEQLKAIDDEK